MPATARLTPLLGARTFQSAPARRMAYKDDQDRESLKPKAQEYSKSGSDDGAAAEADAAFDPNETSPEAEKDTAGKGSAAGNPLEFSPANKDVAAGSVGSTEGKTKRGDNSKSSGGSSPAKGKKV